jgi:uncharacterized membrane protein
MSSILWVAQVFVAVVMTLTGTVKLVVPKERLAQRMHWAAGWPQGRIKLLGLAEVAGAAGLVIPTVTGIAPWLTPLAALCLGILMAGAVRTHQRLGEGGRPRGRGGPALRRSRGRLVSIVNRSVILEWR